MPKEYTLVGDELNTRQLGSFLKYADPGNASGLSKIVFKYTDGEDDYLSDEVEITYDYDLQAVVVTVAEGDEIVEPEGD